MPFWVQGFRNAVHLYKVSSIPLSRLKSITAPVALPGALAKTPRLDARRDAALERAGYRVVRLEASLVIGDIESALERIRAALVG